MSNDLDKFKNELLLELNNKISKEELEIFSKIYDNVSIKYQITKKCTDITISNNNELPDEVKMFFISKKIEGLSDNSLNRYKLVYDKFFKCINKNIKDITSNDIRVFLNLFFKSNDSISSDSNNVQNILKSTNSFLKLYFSL